MGTRKTLTLNLKDPFFNSSLNPNERRIVLSLFNDHITQDDINSNHPVAVMKTTLKIIKLLEPQDERWK